MHPGEIIRALRRSNRWSQLELSERLNVARTYIAQVESGKKAAGMALLRDISKIFDIPVALLVIDDTSNSHVTHQLQRILRDVLDSKQAVAKQAAQ